MTVTVQGMSTLSMTLVCPFGLLLSFWTRLPYLFVLVEPWPYVLVVLDRKSTRRNFSLSGLYGQMSAHDSDRSGVVHLVHDPCLPTWTAFVILDSSSISRISC